MLTENTKNVNAENRSEKQLKKIASLAKENKTVKAGYYKPETITKFSDALIEYKNKIRSGEDLHITISDSNNKMGAVASVSTLPFLTCPARCATTCGRVCYAAKLANLRTNVRNSYAKNTAIALIDPEKYFSEIDRACKSVRYFRFHVSGDIINYSYFERMIEIARNNQKTEFLAFTKCFEIVNSYVENNGGSIESAIPENMHVLYSGGVGVDMINPYAFPETVIIETESDFNDDTMKYCGGNCFNCACRGVGCWQACKGDTIAFKKH